MVLIRARKENKTAYAHWWMTCQSWFLGQWLYSVLQFYSLIYQTVDLKLRPNRCNGTSLLWLCPAFTPSIVFRCRSIMLLFSEIKIWQYNKKQTTSDAFPSLTSAILLNFTAAVSFCLLYISCTLCTSVMTVPWTGLWLDCIVDNFREAFPMTFPIG